MNPREQEIENTLRSAPQPAAPAGLKNKLISQVKLPAGHASSQPVIGSGTFSGWLRRWWPALAPAAVSVACAVAISVQQQEIKELKQSIGAANEKVTARQASPKPDRMESSAAVGVAAARYQQEIEQLKQQAAQLKAEIAQLEKFRAENPQLRSQLAKANLPPELQEFGMAMQEAQDKALRIRCVNNMKQIGLAVRIWAGDNKDMSPPNFLVMSNELGSTRILVCPADTNRPAAANWASFTTANCSYEYLAPSDKDIDREPTRLLIRCPIHGTIGTCDGAVHQLSPERAAQEVIQRDGKLYYGNALDASTSPLQSRQERQEQAMRAAMQSDLAAMQSDSAVLNACINNLRQLDGAKQQWALENRKTAQAIPTAEDIAPYLRRGIPVCPAGGSYQFHAVGARPTCSITGHSLPSFE